MDRACSVGAIGCMGGANRTFACKSQECLWQNWYIFEIKITGRLKCPIYFSASAPCASMEEFTVSTPVLGYNAI